MRKEDDPPNGLSWPAYVVIPLLIIALAIFVGALLIGLRN